MDYKEALKSVRGDHACRDEGSMTEEYLPAKVRVLNFGKAGEHQAREVVANTLVPIRVRARAVEVEVGKIKIVTNGLGHGYVEIDGKIVDLPITKISYEAEGGNDKPERINLEFASYDSDKFKGGLIELLQARSSEEYLAELTSGADGNV